MLQELPTSVNFFIVDDIKTAIINPGDENKMQLIELKNFEVSFIWAFMLYCIAFLCLSGEIMWHQLKIKLT